MLLHETYGFVSLSVHNTLQADKDASRRASHKLASSSHQEMATGPAADSSAPVKSAANTMPAMPQQSAAAQQDQENSKAAQNISTTRYADTATLQPACNKPAVHQRTWKHCEAREGAACCRRGVAVALWWNCATVLNTGVLQGIVRQGRGHPSGTCTCQQRSSGGGAGQRLQPRRRPVQRSTWASCGRGCRRRHMRV